MTPAPSDYTVAPSDLRYLPTAPIIAQRGGDSPTNQPLCEESGTGDRARGNRGKGTNWDRMEKGGGNLCVFCDAWMGMGRGQGVVVHERSSDDRWSAANGR